MFAVQINRKDGNGWIILNGPVPRAKARELRKIHQENNPDYRVRVVPTGDVEMVDA